MNTECAGVGKRGPRPIRYRRAAPAVALASATGIKLRGFHSKSSNSTARKIAESGAQVLGLDSSPEMIGQARQNYPELRFVLQDAAHMQFDNEFDAVFSNAALHWVDGHDALLASLTRGLRPQGQLAVQIPANDDHPTHVIASEVAGESPFREALGSWRRREPVYTPERYAALLHGLGYAAQDVRLQVYGHVLASRDGVFEWVKGSLLTDYERRLGPLFPSFAERYRSRLLAALEDTRPYFYPFKRILLWARRD